MRTVKEWRTVLLSVQASWLACRLPPVVLAGRSHETMSQSRGDMPKARKNPLVRAIIVRVKLLGLDSNQ